MAFSFRALYTNPQEMIADLRDWTHEKDAVIAKAMNRFLYRAQARATGLRGFTTLGGPVFMVRGLQNRRKDPPNPPPGPLKRRSKRLAYAVKVIEAKAYASSGTGGLMEGSLAVNKAEAPYGSVHEYGGIIPRNWQSRFYTGLGRRIGQRKVSTGIQARPFMHPAMEYEFPFLAKEMEKMLRATVKSFGNGRMVSSGDIVLNLGGRAWSIGGGGGHLPGTPAFSRYTRNVARGGG